MDPREPRSAALVPRYAFLDDQELLVRITTHDQTAFRTFFERYAPTARALALRILRDDVLADDVVLEAFRTVWESPEALGAEGRTPRSLLMRCVRDAAVTRARQERSTCPATAPSSSPRPTLSTTVSADPTDASIHQRIVRSALDRLPQDQLRVIESMYLGGLSLRETSATLDVPLQEIVRRCADGMRSLRTDLTRSGVNEREIVTLTVRL
jgi:RNA polymerase sigma factor (sigma-70 family)